MRRRRDIQGLRAVAATLIVAFHAGALVPGGFFAVDIFFVISGFVITAMLLREHDGSGTIALRHFYARRFRRLFPSLALMVVVSSLLGLVLLSPFTWGQLGPSGLTSLFGVSNVYFAIATDGYFDPASDLIPFLHTWSLAVEEQFYLVFPALVIVLMAGRRSARLLTWVVAAATALSFLACVVLTVVPLPGPLSFQGPRLAFYSPMTRAWEFGVGAVAAIALPWLVSRWSSRSAAPLAWAGVAVMGLAFVVVDEQSFPGWSAAIPVIATALVLVSGGLAGDHPTVLGRLLSTRPMTWLGDRSYTWYLWHWTLIVVARQWWPGSRFAEVVAGLLALGVAAAVYRWFEEPIHRGTFVRADRTRPLLTGVLVGSVAACLGVMAASATSLGNDGLREQRAVIAAQHLDQVRGCDDGFVVGGVPAECRWDLEEDRGRLLLIGDSHAGHYVEAFLGAAADLGYSADVATFPSCPVVLDSAGDGACRSFVTDNVAALSTFDEYDLVVVATAAINSVRDPDPSSTATGSAGWWRESVARTLAQIAQRTSLVSVVDNVQFPALMTCLRRSVVSSDPAPGCLTEGEIDGELHDATAQAQQTAMDRIGGHLLDSTPELCGEGPTCSPVDADGTPVYRDVSHITVQESEALADVWADRLGAVLVSSGRR